MEIKRRFLRYLMLLYPTVNVYKGAWKGYADAQIATSKEEEENAWLSISQARYEECKEFPIENIFKLKFRELLEGKELLDIGSNHGGTTYYYYEQFRPKAITGIDTTENQAEISKLYFERRHADSIYNFKKAFAEDLPFTDESFDAIITQDVFEHVQDVLKALNECYRVLKPGGKAFIVFPSYYHPIEHHLNLVTLTPCIHWFFTPTFLMNVYYDILEENPEYSFRAYQSRRPMAPWEKLYSINGTTLREFKLLIKEQPWKNRIHIPFPLGAHGKLVKKYPLLKVLKYLFYIGTRLPIFQEFCNHRIVYILEK